MWQELLKEPEELWILFSFVLFCVLIWTKGRKAVTDSLDARIAAVRSEVDTAQALRMEAEKLFEEFEQKNREAAYNAEQMIRAAERQAADIRARAGNDLSTAITAREKQLSDRIERMKQSAVDDIRRYAADLSLQAARDIIAAKLDAPTRQRLVDQAIGDIAAHIQ